MPIQNSPATFRNIWIAQRSFGGTPRNLCGRLQRIVCSHRRVVGASGTFGLPHEALVGPTESLWEFTTSSMFPRNSRGRFRRILIISRIFGGPPRNSRGSEHKANRLYRNENTRTIGS